MAGVGAGRERVDQVATVRVDVDPLPVVGEVGLLAVGVQRPDAHHPVERRRVERDVVAVVARRRDDERPVVAFLQAIGVRQRLEAHQREVPAGVRARRDRDQLRLVLVAQRLVELLGDLRLVDGPALGEEPLDLDRRWRGPCTGRRRRRTCRARRTGGCCWGRRSRRRRRRPRRATDCPRPWRRLGTNPCRLPRPARPSLRRRPCSARVAGRRSSAAARARWPGTPFLCCRRRRGCGPARRRPRPARGRSRQACRACRSFRR